MTQITWHTKQIKIADLKEYGYNPRRISKKDFERLVNDIKQDGYHNRIIIDTNNVILGGHARKKALIAAGFKQNDIIEVLVSSRTLTEDEFKRINVRDNLPFGEFDFDVLGNHFDASKLIEWGMLPEWLPEKEIDTKSLNTKPELCNKCPYKEKELL